MLVDSHTHLYWDEFKGDFDDVINRAVEAEVLTVLDIGVDIVRSQKAVDSHSDKVKIYSSVGIHPHEAIKYIQDTDEKIQRDMDALEEIYKANPNKVIAIGETGLDFLFENNPDVFSASVTPNQLKELQKKLFRAQIDLAGKLGLPLVIHSRDDRTQDSSNIECWQEVLDMTEFSKGILHCYSGTEEITKKALRSNFLVSFAGNLTYPKNDYLREAVRILPLEKIVIETDAPFLSPQSRRGKRNEPNAVREIAQTIADIKSISLEEVADRTTRNFLNLFNLN